MNNVIVKPSLVLNLLRDHKFLKRHIYEVIRDPSISCAQSATYNPDGIQLDE